MILRDILHKSTLALKAIDQMPMNNYSSEARVHIETIQHKAVDFLREIEREENYFERSRNRGA